MKFRILNKSGHTTMTLETPIKIKREFDKLQKQGFKALTKEGKEIKKAEEIPNTVEELVFGKDAKYSGKRGD
ncbi:unnamed protein product [marine sediment metagenome]|uniref:Uncharacterized protein n=1 Tax=marine sediment metagenome TaxID=412755 RepID=X1JC20_9ZZZZ